MTDLDLDLDDDDFAPSPDVDDLPDLTDLPEAPPAPWALVAEAGQDDLADLEGLGGVGAIPDFVRDTREALGVAVGYARDGRVVDTGYCLRETRQYFNVAPLYLAAKLSLAGAQDLEVAHRVGEVDRIPRGAIVYWTGPSSQYGHVAPSLGGGMVLSTDWPSGRYGKVRADTLAAAWGYDAVWWAPCVNDVRVWSPRRRKPAPTPRITRFFAAEDEQERERVLGDLADEGDGDRPAEVRSAARRLLRAHDLADEIAELQERLADIKDRREALRRSARQALRRYEQS